MLMCTILYKKLCCYLSIIHMKKASLKVKPDKIQTAGTIFNLHLCYNFAVVLLEKGTHFQPISRAKFLQLYYYIIKLTERVVNNATLL